jgi:hypothetical protein
MQKTDLALDHGAGHYFFDLLGRHLLFGFFPYPVIAPNLHIYSRFVE